jgi:signal transduction histidine kinase
MSTDSTALALETPFLAHACIDEFRPELSKILIVAERFDVQELRENLRSEGYQVRSVASPEAAVDSYGSFEPDVLLLDLESSREAALHFCRYLRVTCREQAPAVIFLASRADPAAVVEGLAAGAVDFLSLPLREEDVLARIRVHLMNRHRLAQVKREEMAKNRLLCMAAHDLRNPLVSIRALTNILRARTMGDVNASQQELLDSIYDASQSTLDLVNELLEASVHKAGEIKLTPRPTSLAQVVAASVVLNNASAGSKASHIVLEAGDLPPVLALDEPKIKQVLNNLLGNAVKFSPPGSTITVATEMTGDECAVAVRDQGPGIRESERVRLFKDFSRTSVKPTGGESSTGLGLSICYKIMQAHAGKIEMRNLPEGGAEFRITFPIAQ